jgi:hypothetical protein
VVVEEEGAETTTIVTIKTQVVVIIVVGTPLNSSSNNNKKPRPTNKIKLPRETVVSIPPLILQREGAVQKLPARTKGVTKITMQIMSFF